jgi:hypothetical protein
MLPKAECPSHLKTTITILHSTHFTLPSTTHSPLNAINFQEMRPQPINNPNGHHRQRYLWYALALASFFPTIINNKLNLSSQLLIPAPPTILHRITDQQRQCPQTLKPTQIPCENFIVILDEVSKRESKVEDAHEVSFVEELHAEGHLGGTAGIYKEVVAMEGEPGLVTEFPGGECELVLFSSVLGGFCEIY